MTKENDLTQMLHDWNADKPGAFDRIAPLIYDELKAIAKSQMARERQNHTLAATALVNETFMKLVDAKRMSYSGRSQFFGLASKIMRNLLVDYARERAAGKRGGDVIFVEFEKALLTAGETNIKLEELNDVLDRLEERDVRQARIVELKYFAGLQEQEIAEFLGISLSSVQRDWRMAKAWLFRQLKGLSS